MVYVISRESNIVEYPHKYTCNGKGIHKLTQTIYITYV